MSFYSFTKLYRHEVLSVPFENVWDQLHIPFVPPTSTRFQSYANTTQLLFTGKFKKMQTHIHIETRY